jgi:hypothetical protein
LASRTSQASSSAGTGDGAPERSLSASAAAVSGAKPAWRAAAQNSAASTMSLAARPGCAARRCKSGRDKPMRSVCAKRSSNGGPPPAAPASNSRAKASSPESRPTTVTMAAIETRLASPSSILSATAAPSPPALAALAAAPRSVAVSGSDRP